MPFGLCNALATFQRPMQNCLSEFNLIYCLIYIDDIIVFSWMAEEHLHRLHVVFDWFREYNLKLKLSKCSLFKEEINYLVHWVSKEGMQPSKSDLRSHHWMCTTQNLHGNSSLSWPCGPLLAVYKGICAYCTSTEWTPLGRRCQKEISKRCHYQKMPREPLMLWNRCSWVPQY